MKWNVWEARNAVLTTEFVETTRKTASTTNADSTLNTLTQTQDNANQQGKVRYFISFDLFMKMGIKSPAYLWKSPFVPYEEEI